MLKCNADVTPKSSVNSLFYCYLRLLSEKKCHALSLYIREKNFPQTNHVRERFIL